jgi:hypothetical protein
MRTSVKMESVHWSCCDCGTFGGGTTEAGAQEHADTTGHTGVAAEVTTIETRTVIYQPRIFHEQG